MSEQGVIHDIGYRHYDGPRLGRGYVRRSLFAESLKGAYGFGRSAKSKIMPILLLVAMSLPTLIIAVVSSVINAEELPVGYVAYLFNVQVIIAIFLAAQAPALISRDLRFRVVPLYFSRPMERVDYVQAKYAAMVTALFVLLAVPVTILFLGALLAEMSFTDQLPDYLRGLAAAAVYALVLAGIGLVIAAFTPRRGLGVAAIIAVLLVLSGLQAATSELAREAGEPTVAGYFGLLSPFSLVDGLVGSLLGGDVAVADGAPGTAGAVVFTVVALLLVVGSYAVLLIRYRKASAA